MPRPGAAPRSTRRGVGRRDLRGRPPRRLRATEATMPHKVRVNLANPFELRELPGVGPREVDAILKYRSEHGPIEDAAQLAQIVGSGVAPETLAPHVDFAPSDGTAPEA